MSITLRIKIWKEDKCDYLSSVSCMKGQRVELSQEWLADICCEAICFGSAFGQVLLGSPSLPVSLMRGPRESKLWARLSLSLSHWHKKMSSIIVLVMVTAWFNLLLVKWSSRTTKTFAARRLSLCVNVHGFTSLVVPNPSWNPWSHRFKCPFGITFWRKKCHMLAKKRHLSLTNKIKLYIYIYIYILGSKNIYLNFFSPHPKKTKQS